ncbi:LysR substrate-binding domain-containing protein [Pseudomonas sp. NPDC007930]|uniref:LysR substrate-binding domain-containing protein n=1 Tax=Pseudomonas sp. NPDC007930 TaxID=3364417 RepID=UPI0036E9814A
MAHLPSIATLRAFEAAARLNSFSRAAHELCVTHSAISHRIRELEAQVGEPLFTRRGNAMEPTAAAGRYLGAVRQALALLSAAFATGAAQGAACTLRIAVLPSLASHWLVARLAQFQALHPNIAITLEARLEIVPLGPPHAHAAIRHGHGEWPGAQATKLLEEAAFPVCTPAYRDSLNIRTPADLARCTLLRHSWSPWTPWFNQAQLDLPEPTASAVYTDAGLLLDIALAGHGVLLGRSLLVADALASGRLVRLFDTAVPVAGAYWFVVPRVGGQHVEQCQVFGEWLAGVMG